MENLICFYLVVWILFLIALSVYVCTKTKKTDGAKKIIIGGSIVAMVVIHSLIDKSGIPLINQTFALIIAGLGTICLIVGAIHFFYGVVFYVRRYLYFTLKVTLRNENDVKKYVKKHFFGDKKGITIEEISYGFDKSSEIGRRLWRAKTLSEDRTCRYIYLRLDGKEYTCNPMFEPFRKDDSFINEYGYRVKAFKKGETFVIIPDK